MIQNAADAHRYSDSWSRDESDITGEGTDDVLAYYFPTAFQEHKRISMVHRCNLFNRPIPDPHLRKIMTAHVEDILKEFPTATCAFITAFGERSYRTLMALPFDKVGEDFFKQAMRSSKFAEFGCKNLSACQYVVEEGHTLMFNESTGSPKFVELFVKNRGAFERCMMKSDPLYKKYIEDAKKRGVWKIFESALSGKKQSAAKIAKLVNMFELFVYFDLNYIGCPIKIDGSIVGVICLLYDRDQNMHASNVDFKPKINLMESLAGLIASSLQQNKGVVETKEIHLTEENAILTEKVTELKTELKLERRKNVLRKCCLCFRKRRANKSVKSMSSSH